MEVFKFDIVTLDCKKRKLSSVLHNLVFIVLFIVSVPDVGFRFWVACMLVIFLLGSFISGHLYLNSPVVIGNMYIVEEKMVVSINDNVNNFSFDEYKIGLVNAGYKGMNVSSPFSMVGFFSSHSGIVLVKMHKKNESFSFNLKLNTLNEYNVLMKYSFKKEIL